MNITFALTTILGGFILPFFIVMFWDKFVEKFGSIGGWIAAFFIVGTIWRLNHGSNNPLIHQNGKIWIDMAWAAGIGVLSASLVSGDKIKKSISTLFAAVIGGILGGFILFLF